MDYELANNTYSAVPKTDVNDKIEVEVGDSKQVDFYPQVKIMRWDNEVNFSARLVTSVAQEPSKTGAVISTENVKFYDLPVSEDLPEGGYEFEVILKEKPASNKIQFTLQDKGLEYFYQPELTQEEIDEGASRPENVVGSYAVYYADCPANIVGGKEYKVGKALHIYRPKIQDADGNWVWGELNIADGMMTVTIPQDFLDKAVYPVTHAAGATFGYTSVGASQADISGGATTSIYGHNFTATAGDIASMSVYNQTYSSAGTAGMGIYTTSKIGNTDTFNSNASFGWTTKNITCTVTAATHYLCYMIGTTGFSFKYDSSGSSSRYYKYPVSPYAWPSTVSWTLNDSGHTYSIYATYTESGGTTSTSSTSSSISTSSTSSSTSVSTSQSISTSSTSSSTSTSTTVPIFDSYSESGVNGYWAVDNEKSGSDWPGIAQSITGINGYLDSVRFYLKKSGSPTGSAYARLYDHTGTFGSSSKPTGSALATSDAFDVSTLTTSSELITLRFTGANRYLMSVGTKYCISFEFAGGDISNKALVGSDSFPNTAPGNVAQDQRGGVAADWVASDASDLAFYAYAEVVACLRTDLIGITFGESFTTSTSSTSSSTSTSASISTSSTSQSTSTSQSISTSSTSSSTSTSISVSTSSTSQSTSTSRSISTSSTSSSTSRSTSTSISTSSTSQSTSTSRSISTSSTSQSISTSSTSSSTSVSQSTSTSTTLSMTTSTSSTSSSTSISTSSTSQSASTSRSISTSSTSQSTSTSRSISTSSTSSSTSASTSTSTTTTVPGTTSTSSTSSSTSTSISTSSTSSSTSVSTSSTSQSISTSSTSSSTSRSVSTSSTSQSTSLSISTSSTSSSISTSQSVSTSSTSQSTSSSISTSSTSSSTSTTISITTSTSSTSTSISTSSTSMSSTSASTSTSTTLPPDPRTKGSGYTRNPRIGFVVVPDAPKAKIYRR